MFGNLFEVVEGFVKVGLVANSRWFRVDVVSVHLMFEIGLQFTVWFGIGLGLVRDLLRVDLWFIEDWFKV